MTGRATMWAALALAASVLLGLTGTAAAQVRLGPSPTPATAAAPPADATTEALIILLEDDAARARLIEALRRGANAPAEAAPDPAANLLPGGVLLAFSNALESFGGQIGKLAGAIGDPRGLGAWFVAQVEDPAYRTAWAWILGQLAAALGAGIVVAWIARFALRRPSELLAARAYPQWWWRVPLALLHAVLAAVPVAGFGLAAYLVVAALAPTENVALIVLSVVAAVAASRAGNLLARILFSPQPNVRALPLTDDVAVYLYTWARRFIDLTVIAYAAAHVLALLGMPAGGLVLVVNLFGMVIALLAVVFILQNRRPVARWIAGTATGNAEPGAGDARMMAGMAGVSMMRNRVGETWHVLAIVYVAAAWAVWTLNIPGGFSRMTINTTATVLVVGAAWVAVRLSRAGLDRLLSVTTEVRDRYPFVAQRADLYLPMLYRIVAFVIQLGALVMVLQLWGLDVVGSLSSPTARSIFSRGLHIAMILAITVMIWEGSSDAVRMYLEGSDGQGRPRVPSQRARTLLPLLRNVLRVIVVTFAGMAVLSELGMSVGPLLAGAGVAGVAVGFGAQTLVKDVITGMFILLEDSIQVGDVVKVAGESGVVEAMTVRSLRLRDEEGNVFTVPFSSVTTIENRAKNFAFALIDVPLAYGDDYDRAVTVLQTIGAEMRNEHDLGHAILQPMEVVGIEEMAEKALIVRVRFKTRPLQQWHVRREFYRRLAAQFPEAGLGLHKRIESARPLVGAADS